MLNAYYYTVVNTYRTVSQDHTSVYSDWTHILSDRYIMCVPIINVCIILFYKLVYNGTRSYRQRQ